MAINNSNTVTGPEIYDENIASRQVATGDLFSPIDMVGESNYAGIVLTPLCDLVQKKVEWVKLSLAIPFKIYLQEVFIPERFKGMDGFREEIKKDAKAFGRSYLRDSNKRLDSKTLGLVKELQRIVKNVNPRHPAHYYLQGKEKPTAGFLVDFSHVFSVPYHKLATQRPLLRLKSPWREQLLNRYVAFSLRIGTRDYSKESICRTIQAFFPELDEEKIYMKLQ